MEHTFYEKTVAEIDDVNQESEAYRIHSSELSCSRTRKHRRRREPYYGMVCIFLLCVTREG